MKYNDYIKLIEQELENMVVTDRNGDVMSHDEGFNRWIDYTFELYKNNKNLFLVGNGASATMASHMAADATKNGHLKALAFNDSALMTASSNDVSFEACFALPLERFSQAKDTIISISSSGNSPNVIAALRKARERSLVIITLSGMEATNRSRQLGDLNFYVPASTYGIVECSHQVLLHYWLDEYIEKAGLKDV